MATTYEYHRYSMNYVKQGKHRFFTLSMPSGVLAATCFVSRAEDNPARGFQRLLDKKRAQQIAEYIDNGLGTIPGSIVLSAQPDADLKVIGNGKTLQFLAIPKAFLIIDGQHRIYGFKLAKTKDLRVPVVIYNNLQRVDETRLFIDINTKQKPVPSELLLEIKKLALYETDIEKQLGTIFDMFDKKEDSALYGLTSPRQKTSGKISRVTFNIALKPIITELEEIDEQKIYNTFNEYLHAFKQGCVRRKAPEAIANPTVFRAAALLFMEVVRTVRDRYGESGYKESAFASVLEPVFHKLPATWLKSPGRSAKQLYEKFFKRVRKGFSL